MNLAMILVTKFVSIFNVFAYLTLFQVSFFFLLDSYFLILDLFRLTKQRLIYEKGESNNLEYNLHICTWLKLCHSICHCRNYWRLWHLIFHFLSFLYLYLAKISFSYFWEIRFACIEIFFILMSCFFYQTALLHYFYSREAFIFLFNYYMLSFIVRYY